MTATLLQCLMEEDGMTLETERLLLREHQRKDFDRFWEMLRDPIAKQYTGA